MDGVNVEVLGYSVVGNRYAIRLTKAEVLEFSEGYADLLIELIDRKHLNAALTREAALREELAGLQSSCAIDRRHLDRMIDHGDDLQQRLTAAEHRNYGLVELLRIMAGDYARCLEAGYDRITFLGGDCDTVAKMLDDNPNYAKAIAACAKPTESGASE